MGRLVMNYWDCPVCGNKEIRGDVVKCPSCGRARGDDIQFYIKGYTEGTVLSKDEAAALGAEEVDAGKAAEIGKNPDWYCSFCNSLNNDKLQVCGTCGASRADSEANYFQMLEKNKAKEAAELAAQPHPDEPQKKRPKWLLFAALAVVALLVYLLWPKTIKGQITAVNWTRSISIEEYKQVPESCWDQPPAGAESITTKREMRTRYRRELVTREVTRREKVQVGTQTKVKYVNLGNGMSEEVEYEEPVYDWVERRENVQQWENVPYTELDTKYYYYMWRWSPGREVTASGDDQNPYWPEYELGEKEREGTHTAVYRFTATDEKGNPTTYRIVESNHAESDWIKLPVGTEVKINNKKTVSDMSGNKIADIKVDQ